MKLCTFEHKTQKSAGIVRDGKILPVAEVNARQGTKFPEQLLALIETGAIDELKQAAAGVEAELPLAEVRLRLPYEDPPKIWCIGLNYYSHAQDIKAVQPDEPGSFMKPTSTLFEPDGTIELPPEDIAREVDAEGELGLDLRQALPRRADRCHW